MPGLKIAIVSTDYPPLRTSAAVQLRDLAAAFAEQGHHPVVIVPGQLSGKSWAVEQLAGIETLRLNARETRAVGYIRRAFAEMSLPFAMYRSLRDSPHGATTWDIVTWYSPPIFFAPLIFALVLRSKAQTYLILRDLFPEWALDLGLLRKGPAYYFLKATAALQYAVADVIGVQTQSNLKYLDVWRSPKRRIEVLPNWLAVTPNIGCSIRISETQLAGRTIFGYIGNMGVAQGMDIFVDLIESLLNSPNIGFVFVGRGSDLTNLVEQCRSRQLDNVLFFDEIDSLEIPGLLAQCDVGMVALHPDHKTHNIPGKFVSYVRYGLPVLARVNAGADLIKIIEGEDIGRVYTGRAVGELRRLAIELADDVPLRIGMSRRGRQLGERMFSPQAAAAQITGA